ncbi:putative cytochrome P450 [Nemania serpens]|nr:putative cytochrome P450 [Nemania serpens]
MASALVFAALLAPVCLYVLNRRATRSSLPLPPGPRALPVIGNVHQAPKSHAWLQYHSWGKVYGPVVHLSMFGQSVIILSTSQAAHDLLAKRGATFSDRPHLVVAGLALKGLNMLLMPYNERFKLHQKLGFSVLNVKAAAAYLPFQAMESRQLLFDLLHNAGGSGVSCHEYFERTTASIIYGVLYGFRVKSTKNETLLAALALNDEFSEIVSVGAHLVDTFPVLNNLPAFLAPWKAKAESHWKRQVSLHVGNLQGGLKATGWNFSKHLHKSIETEGINMPTEELAFELGTLVDAALDGTTESLMWFVVACITQNRGFIIKAREYLDAVVGHDRLPTFEDRPNLSSYEGYKIPANSVVIPNHWAIAREEAVFGPDVDSFVPARWLETEGTQKNELKDIPVVGFGYGRRVCPGRHFARNIIWISIARLLWAFDIEAGVSETGDPLTIDPMASTDGLVMRPSPFKASFKPRGPWVQAVIERKCDTSSEDLASMLTQIGADLSKQ